MKPLTFYIVDVFAEAKYAGNQLAVFRSVQGLSENDMQKIAGEMHFSETTFILSDTERDGGYDVRIFTPAREVPFAGHPTLGTAYVIRDAILRRPVERVNLNLGVGQIPVSFEPGDHGTEILWMTPKEAVFGEVFDRRAVAPLLTVREDDIDDAFPIQSVSTGIPFILVPLRTLDAVKAAGVHRDQWLEWVTDKEAKCVFVFCPEPTDPANHIHARMFADYVGVPEDPATGSANCCFAAYLVRHRYFGADRIDVRVEQGYEIGRPSLLYLRAEQQGERIHVRVGGKVVNIAKGNLV
ncbi:MAG: PhzF family phenazine biosynthesis protein [Planctomycetota bacterium]|jgi:trans-2,3-dihydro-3-hydroxyanthranilate isomerase